MDVEFTEIAGTVIGVLLIVLIGLLYCCLPVWDFCRWIRRKVIDYFRTRNHVPLSNAESTQSINQPQPNNRAAVTQNSPPTTGPRRRKSPPQLENISPDNVNQDLKAVDTRLDEKATGGVNTGGNENLNSDTRVENATILPLSMEGEDIVIYTRSNEKISERNAADRTVPKSSSDGARPSIV